MKKNELTKKELKDWRKYKVEQISKDMEKDKRLIQILLKLAKK